MFKLVDYPLLVLVVSFLVLWLAAQMGMWLRNRRRRRDGEDDQRDDFGVVLAAILTLLGLIIGFSFSMAISRYDQRKNFEEEEANAIGTEYVRASLMLPEHSGKVQALLKDYLDQRLLYYTTRNPKKVRQIDGRTAQLHGQLWSTVAEGSKTVPPPIMGLVLSGMNDVINRQGYTQAAWFNRIPRAAWIMMVAIAVLCSLLIGFGARRKDTVLFLILPLAASISFFLIADIDSPRGGTIRVHPQNLESLSRSLH